MSLNGEVRTMLGGVEEEKLVGTIGRLDKADQDSRAVRDRCC